MSRCPFALWKPGVTNFGYPRGTHGQLRANNPHRAFLHDAQGWRGGAYSTFLDPNRGGAHVIINLDGPPWQFIDLDDAAWHAGGTMPGLGEFANLFAWGIEFEGGYPTPTPITDYQIDQGVRLCRWLSTEYAFTWKAERRDDLWEHAEVYPTDCPSARIRWPQIIAGLKGQTTMPDTIETLRADLATLQKTTATQLEDVNQKWGGLYVATRVLQAVLLDDRAANAQALDAGVAHLRKWPTP